MPKKGIAMSRKLTLPEVEVLAKTLISEFAPVGWQFAWSSEKRVNGRCFYNIKTIKLSRHLTPLRTPEDVRLTIMHEICHSLVGPGHGHGPVWRAKMRSFGLPANRCSQDTPDLSTISNWAGSCPSCGKISYMIRKPRNDRSCGTCCPKVYNVKYKLTWRRI